MNTKIFIICVILSIVILCFFIKPVPQPVIPVISKEIISEPEFCLPVENGIVSSPFGSRNEKMHEGVDIAVPCGTEVCPALPGVVRFAGALKGYGLTVVLDHDDSFLTLYAHLDSINVEKGDAVSTHDIIALSGNSGTSTGPHLHFEIRQNEIPLNPEDFIII